ncbi:hypothetical protein RHMOL_Rhmol07G0191000 [Rhododendron molle]|uniref:Uncharacterized protein n=1 Tax=Rhododendron molle TaxID=49168 RepID=A0ACC0N2I9_RHOML|nr:hypothetical protein RHMOL_Rhmol07G0191000 [Rhododendron molle]
MERSALAPAVAVVGLPGSLLNGMVQLQRQFGFAGFRFLYHGWLVVAWWMLVVKFGGGGCSVCGGRRRLLS